MRRVNLIEQKFGLLTVIKYAGVNKNQQSLWLCQCSCSLQKEIIVSNINLKNNHTKSCGCLRHKQAINFKDLTGKIFDRLTVIKYLYTKKGIAFWLCKCICGEEITVKGPNLNNGHTKSCGCLLKDRIRETCFIDISGQTFGRLLVLKFLYIKNNNSYFLCKCSCINGTEVEVISANLKRGTTKSCGCLRNELSVVRGKLLFTTHGLRKTRFHKVWEGMMARCYNSKHISYPNYGGRGIKVCDRWHSFVNFIEDKYQSYLDFSLINGEKKTTGDRPNPNGNYEPTNHKWATPKEQGLTRRNSSRTKNLKEHNYWKNKLRNIILKSIKIGLKDETLFQYYVGCTVAQFKSYIESLWFPGMTWDNHGTYPNNWQLDHMVECYKFDLCNEQARKNCFNFKNYQPMWYDKHLEKTLIGNKG